MSMSQGGLGGQNLGYLQIFLVSFIESFVFGKILLWTCVAGAHSGGGGGGGGNYLYMT